jgi:hypothetical protein
VKKRKAKLLKTILRHVQFHPGLPFHLVTVTLLGVFLVRIGDGDLMEEKH